ncbi:hypothetical protein [Streptomyces sp. B1I3]|uniref:hypothetical protein n=1 Tax=Streptomyces sp. B1I3 TaxID=3042264 RepID=UPI0027812878|nr:hypothetical protein [Streptomyces sp. B1I3]MDQ0796184.1 hypothetical protein [Streptomyces sp. B1I3]
MTDGIVGAITGFFRGRGREDELARIDAEITAFGEALAGHSFAPGGHADDEGLVTDYQRALDAYEQAKQNFVGDRTLRDAADVLRSLDEGRHALACVDAAMQGRPRPSLRPLCFFDPRHGPSTEEVRWAPSEGAVRTIAVCAADAIRISEGVPPIASGLSERQPGPHPPSPPDRRPAAASAREAGKRTPDRRTPAAAAQPASSPASSAPYETWPQDTGVQQHRKGRGSTGVQLVRTDLRKPALLVVHLDRAEDSWVELTSPPGERGIPQKILTHGSVLTRAIVPVPADGRDRVILQMATKRGWRIWLHPADHIPALTEEVRSTGTYVLRHPGGRMPLRVTQNEGTSFSLHELRPDFTPGALLVDGEGPFTASATTSRRPGLLYVRSCASWSITPTGGVHKAPTTP